MILSIYQVFCFFKLFFEIWILDAGFIDKINFPAEKGFQCMIEIEEVIGIVGMVYVRIEIHEYIDIAVFIKSGCEYGSEGI